MFEYVIIMKENTFLTQFFIFNFFCVTLRVSAIYTECPAVRPFDHTPLVQHEYDCTKFYSCVGTTKVLMDCPYNIDGTRLHFNPELMVCDYPENAGCSLRSETVQPEDEVVEFNKPSSEFKNSTNYLPNEKTDSEDSTKTTRSTINHTLTNRSTSTHYIEVTQQSSTTQVYENNDVSQNDSHLINNPSNMSVSSKELGVEIPSRNTIIVTSATPRTQKTQIGIEVTPSVSQKLSTKNYSMERTEFSDEFDNISTSVPFSKETERHIYIIDELSTQKSDENGLTETSTQNTSEEELLFTSRQNGNIVDISSAENNLLHKSTLQQFSSEILDENGDHTDFSTIQNVSKDQVTSSANTEIGNINYGSTETEFLDKTVSKELFIQNNETSPSLSNSAKTTTMISIGSDEITNLSSTSENIQASEINNISDDIEISTSKNNYKDKINMETITTTHNNDYKNHQNTKKNAQLETVTSRIEIEETTTMSTSENDLIKKTTSKEETTSIFKPTNIMVTENLDENETTISSNVFKENESLEENTKTTELITERSITSVAESNSEEVTIINPNERIGTSIITIPKFETAQWFPSDITKKVLSTEKSLQSEITSTIQEVEQTSILYNDFKNKITAKDDTETETTELMSTEKNDHLQTDYSSMEKNSKNKYSSTETSKTKISFDKPNSEGFLPETTTTIKNCTTSETPKQSYITVANSAIQIEFESSQTDESKDLNTEILTTENLSTSPDATSLLTSSKDLIDNTSTEKNLKIESTTLLSSERYNSFYTDCPKTKPSCEKNNLSIKTSTNANKKVFNTNSESFSEEVHSTEKMNMKPGKSTIQIIPNFETTQTVLDNSNTETLNQEKSFTSGRLEKSTGQDATSTSIFYDYSIGSTTTGNWLESKLPSSEFSEETDQFHTVYVSTARGFETDPPSIEIFTEADVYTENLTLENLSTLESSSIGPHVNSTSISHDESINNYNSENTLETKTTILLSSEKNIDSDVEYVDNESSTIANSPFIETSTDTDESIINTILKRNSGEETTTLRIYTKPENSIELPISTNKNSTIQTSDVESSQTVTSDNLNTETSTTDKSSTFVKKINGNLVTIKTSTESNSNEIITTIRICTKPGKSKNSTVRNETLVTQTTSNVETPDYMETETSPEYMETEILSTDKLSTLGSLSTTPVSLSTLLSQDDPMENTTTGNTLKTESTKLLPSERNDNFHTDYPDTKLNSDEDFSSVQTTTYVDKNNSEINSESDSNRGSVTIRFCTKHGKSTHPSTTLKSSMIQINTEDEYTDPVTPYDSNTEMLTTENYFPVSENTETTSVPITTLISYDNSNDISTIENSLENESSEVSFSEQNDKTYTDNLDMNSNSEIHSPSIKISTNAAERTTNAHSESYSSEESTTVKMCTKPGKSKHSNSAHIRSTIGTPTKSSNSNTVTLENYNTESVATSKSYDDFLNTSKTEDELDSVTTVNTSAEKLDSEEDFPSVEISIDSEVNDITIKWGDSSDKVTEKSKNCIKHKNSEPSSIIGSSTIQTVTNGKSSSSFSKSKSDAIPTTKTEKPDDISKTSSERNSGKETTTITIVNKPRESKYPFTTTTTLTDSLNEIEPRMFPSSGKTTKNANVIKYSSPEEVSSHKTLSNNTTTESSNVINTSKTLKQHHSIECPPFGIILHLPHETNCSMFYTCDYGKRILKKCPLGLNFNPLLQVCDWPINVNCHNLNKSHSSSPIIQVSSPFNRCPPEDYNHTILLSHECNSQKYYICRNGEQILRHCPHGTHFNVTIQKCIIRTKYDISATRNNTNSIETITESNNYTVTDERKLNSANLSGNFTKNPNFSRNVSTEFIGRKRNCPKMSKHVSHIPHESNCSLFYTYKNGSKSLHKCPNNLYFNAEKKYCDWSKHVNCNTNTSNLTSELHNMDSGSNNDITNISKNSSSLECPKIHTGLAIHLPHENNCSLFYKCDKGEKVLFNCPYPLYFNPKIEVCDYQHNVNCTMSQDEHENHNHDCHKSGRKKKEHHQ